MGFRFNPFTGTLDLVGSTSTGTTNNNYFNSIQVDQSGGASDTYGVLSGTINGSNKVFTVSNHSYVTGTLSVYLNGQLLTQGNTEDWVETAPSLGTFTFANAPLSGDQITVIYTMQTTGGINYTIVTKTDDYTLTSSDYTVLIDASSNDVDITLPSASGQEGRVYNVKRLDDSSFSATLVGTIDDATNVDISVQYMTVTVISNGEYWYIL